MSIQLHHFHMEDRVGIAPTNTGFADQDLNCLATYPMYTVLNTHMAHRAEVESATYRLEGGYSIQLS